MALLSFLKKITSAPSPIANFWELRDHDIPDAPGAYILFAKPAVRFLYPNGKSSVYYIGQSKSLRRRLRAHLKWHTEVRKNKRSLFPVYEARYEYGGKFGQRYCFITTWQGLTPRGLEDMILARFAKQYKTFPVANGAAAWNKVEHEFKRAEL